MGSYDSAEVCELVGAFMLSKLRDIHENIGLYRDDGLAALEGIPARRVDAVRKDIIKTFKMYGLSITVESNLKVVNFLDVTFNLYSGKFYPYRKPNDRPVYINAR